MVRVPSATPHPVPWLACYSLPAGRLRARVVFVSQASCSRRGFAIRPMASFRCAALHLTCLRSPSFRPGNFVADRVVCWKQDGDVQSDVNIGAYLQVCMCCEWFILASFVWVAMSKCRLAWAACITRCVSAQPDGVLARPFHGMIDEIRIWNKVRLPSRLCLRHFCRSSWGSCQLAVLTRGCACLGRWCRLLRLRRATSAS